MHALMLASSQRLLARTHASAALDAGSHRDGFKLDLAAALAYSPWVKMQCLRHVRAPRPQTSAGDKQGRSSRGCCGLCHTRAATTTESHTGFLSASDKPGPGVSARPGPEGKGLLFGLVLCLFFFLMLRNREQPQHNPTSPTRPQKPQSSAFTTRKKKIQKTRDPPTSMTRPTSDREL